MIDNPPDVTAKITAILADILVLNPEDIKPSSKLVDDLDADSIAFLEDSYRLRTDFGLEVPEAKADEETLRLPMANGLERLEKTAGGTSLFEFIKADLLRGGQGEDQGGGLDRMLGEALDKEQLAAFLKEAVATAGKSDDARRAVGALMLDLRQRPERSLLLEEVLQADAALASEPAGWRRRPGRTPAREAPRNRICGSGWWPAATRGGSCSTSR